MTQLRNHDSDFIYMHIDISLLSQICQKGTLTQNELNNYTTCNQWICHVARCTHELFVARVLMCFSLYDRTQS